jgi:hypothetical protein
VLLSWRRRSVCNLLQARNASLSIIVLANILRSAISITVLFINTLIAQAGTIIHIDKSTPGIFLLAVDPAFLIGHRVPAHG